MAPLTTGQTDKIGHVRPCPGTSRPDGHGHHPIGVSCPSGCPGPVAPPEGAVNIGSMSARAYVGPARQTEA